jgi:heme A synthase
MPWSVRVAAAALVFAILALAVFVVAFARQGEVPRVQTGVALAVFILVLAGFVRARRAAWQWGRAVGFLLSALLFAAAIVAAWRVLPRQVLAEDGLGAAIEAAGFFLPLLVPLLGLAAPLLAVAIALGRPSAYAWFGLVCPHCGARAPRAADLRFHEARCRACGERY